MSEAAQKHDKDDMNKRLHLMRWKGLNNKIQHRFVSERDYAKDINKIQKVKNKEDKL